MSHIDSGERKRYLIRRYREENPLDTYYLSDEDIECLIEKTWSGAMFTCRLDWTALLIEVKKSFGLK